MIRRDASIYIKLEKFYMVKKNANESQEHFCYNPVTLSALASLSISVSTGSIETLTSYSPLVFLGFS